MRQGACYAALLLRSIAALLTIVLAACGGGGTPAAGPNASAANESTAAPSGAAAAAPSQAADSGPSFAEILQSGKLTSYKISYKMTTSGTGQDASASLDQTWYFKPPNTRFDMVGGASTGGGKISMFLLEKGTFMCTEASGQSSCFQVPGEQAAGQNMGFELQSTFQDDPGAFNATKQEQRTIAGQQAYCYVLAGTPVTGFTSGTFCYTKTGVPLLSEWTAQGATFKLEATSFSATVPDSDFELPATPGSY